MASHNVYSVYQNMRRYTETHENHQTLSRNLFVGCPEAFARRSYFSDGFLLSAVIETNPAN